MGELLRNNAAPGTTRAFGDGRLMERLSGAVYGTWIAGVAVRGVQEGYIDGRVRTFGGIIHSKTRRIH